MTADHMTGGGSGLAPVYGAPSSNGVVPIYSVLYWCGGSAAGVLYWVSPIATGLITLVYFTCVIPVYTMYITW